MKVNPEKVLTITRARRRLKQGLRDLIGELNPVLRGWGNYFAVGNSSRQLWAVDSFVRERLYLFLSKKRHKSGRGCAER